MNSSALRNPSNPDKAYRNKFGRQHRGYVADIEETIGKNGSVVTTALIGKEASERVLVTMYKI